MERSVLDRSLEEVAVESDAQQAIPLRGIPSYRPTRWTLVNRVLDIVDDVTHGKAGLCQRFFTFAFIGGLAALVNMAVFATVTYGIKFPASEEWLQNAIASVLAAEISIMANFIPNDYFTFRGLYGHSRSWSARCLRFHITSIGGSVLTYLIETGFHFLGHVPALAAQAVALILVLFYNFTFHHLFTYRHVKPAVTKI
jgi:putative flippase GtrA